MGATILQDPTARCGVTWLMHTLLDSPAGVCKAVVCLLSAMSAHTSGRARADSSRSPAEIREPGCARGFALLKTST